MWSYLLRRLLLMIPTLFGVTLVSFAVMQMAPGDPLLLQGGDQGSLAAQGETREAYLVRRRDLKLDRPLFLNLRYFRDWTEPVRHAAWFLGVPVEQLAQDLAPLARLADQTARARLRFLHQLDIPELDRRLQRFFRSPGKESPEQIRAGRLSLARTVRNYVQVFCENLSFHGVPAAVKLLEQESSERMRRGLAWALRYMVVEPFRYEFSDNPQPEEVQEVEATWRRWAQLNPQFLQPLLQEQQKAFHALLEKLLQTSQEQWSLLLEQVPQMDRFLHFLLQHLLDPQSPLEEKAACARILASELDPLPLVPREDASAETLEQIAQNWQLHYRLHRQEYHPSWGRRLWLLVADTQYAYMLVRLATFNFGRSTLRTQEPVSQKIWEAFKVSAPLMALSQVLIYLIAVPLGVICAVKHNSWVDRAISLGLFILYSIPAYVAGMLLLLFFCYGDYLKWFPSGGLHSEGAQQMSPWAYWLDYLHHIVLPTLCLTLFSLAALAMYSRTSMLEVLGQDYIRTARAKGLSEAKVILKHALRNALIPIITLFSNTIPAVLGGSVLIEYLFNIPGMGRLTFESIENKDYPTLMALVYINAIVVMISILASDILYVLVDPRISFQKRSQAG